MCVGSWLRVWYRRVPAWLFGSQTQLFRLWTSRRLTRLGVVADERELVLRQGINRLDEMIKGQVGAVCVERVVCMFWFSHS